MRKLFDFRYLSAAYILGVYAHRGVKIGILFGKRQRCFWRRGITPAVYNAANADTLELLKKHRPKGVVHSFSGSAEMAKEILNLGMYIGIGGVLTFKNAKKLPEIAAVLPSDRFLLETDAPYLAPVPYRSKINNSALILLVAEKLAELRNTDCESILRSSFENAEKIFGI